MNPSFVQHIDHVVLRVIDLERSVAFYEAVLLAHLIDQKVEVLGPAAYNFGAEGVGLSLYFSDPDGNIVELKGPAQEA